MVFEIQQFSNLVPTTSQKLYISIDNLLISFNIETQKEKPAKMHNRDIINAYIVYLPNSEIFCLWKSSNTLYSCIMHEKRGVIKTFHPIQEKGYFFRLVYYKNWIYMLARSSNGNSSFSRLNLADNQINYLSECGNYTFIYYPIVFKESILFGQDKNYKLLKYDLLTESCSEVFAGFHGFSSCILLWESRLYSFESGGSLWISEADDEYNWKYIGKLPIFNIFLPSIFPKFTVTYYNDLAYFGGLNELNEESKETKYYEFKFKSLEAKELKKSKCIVF